METLPPKPSTEPGEPTTSAAATAATAAATVTATTTPAATVTTAKKCDSVVDDASDSDNEDFVNNARQLERPWLRASPDGWTHLGFVKHPQNWDRLYRRLSVSPTRSALRLPGNISRKIFVDRCERLNIPCILEGCMKHWIALKRWSWESLKKRFPDVCWRVSDIHGATLSMDEMDAYCSSTQVRDATQMPNVTTRVLKCVCLKSGRCADCTVRQSIPRATHKCASTRIRYTTMPQRRYFLSV